jgi:mRNA interferase RelE/StbE
MSYDIVFTRRFHKDYAGVPHVIQEKADQQICRLADGDSSYPSLRTKKMEGEENIWEASVTMNYRMVLSLEEDLITLLRIGTHDIL